MLSFFYFLHRIIFAFYLLLSFYEIQFLLHAGSASCLRVDYLLCAAGISLYDFRIYRAFCAPSQMIGRLPGVIIRLRIELMTDSIVYTMLDLFHGTFRAYSFESDCCVLVANLIRNENSLL